MDVSIDNLEFLEKPFGIYDFSTKDSLYENIWTEKTKAIIQ